MRQFLSVFGCLLSFLIAIASAPAEVIFDDGSAHTIPVTNPYVVDGNGGVAAINAPNSSRLRSCAIRH